MVSGGQLRGQFNRTDRSDNQAEKGHDSNENFIHDSAILEKTRKARNASRTSRSQSIFIDCYAGMDNFYRNITAQVVGSAFGLMSRIKF